MLRPVCYILSLLLTLMVGCTTHHDVAEQIRRAESLYFDKPDSALEIIRSINPDILRNKHDRALYQLVYSEALYYNRIDSDNDSITRPMIEYYRTSDNHTERARAFYMHAFILHTAGKEAEAMLNLMEAESSCNHIDNPRLAGIIHRTKGEIYGDGCLFNNALAEYQAAKVNFIKAGLEYHSAYADYDIGRIFNCLQKFDDAETYQKRALKYAESIDSPELIAEIALALLRQYLSTEEYDKLVSTLRYYEQHLIKYSSLYHIYKGIDYAHHGDINKAIANMELAHQHGCDPLLLEYAYYSIYRNVNDYKMALQYHERIIEQQNKLVLSSLNAPILNLQIDIAKRDQRILENDIKRTKIVYTLFITIIMILIVVIILIFRHKQLRQRHKMEHYISTIQQLQYRLNNISPQMGKSVEALYKSRFEELNKLCDIYYDSSGTTRQTKMVFEQLHSIIDHIKSDKKRMAQLEDIINEYCEDVVTKLNEQCPKLSQRQKRIAIYSYAGFSLRAIAIFMDSNPTQISKDKYKIKSIIQNSGCADHDKLIKHL